MQNFTKKVLDGKRMVGHFSIYKENEWMGALITYRIVVGKNTACYRVTHAPLRIDVFDLSLAKKRREKSERISVNQLVMEVAHIIKENVNEHTFRATIDLLEVEPLDWARCVYIAAKEISAFRRERYIRYRYDRAGMVDAEMADNVEALGLAELLREKGKLGKAKTAADKRAQVKEVQKAIDEAGDLSTPAPVSTPTMLSNEKIATMPLAEQEFLIKKKMVIDLMKKAKETPAQAAARQQKEYEEIQRMVSPKPPA